MPRNDTFCCLFGRGPATVIGAPANFDLCASIVKGSEIRLATAFAHASGWKLVEQAFSRSNARTHLLTGLDFCQTDPKVLKAWVALAGGGRASARLYIGPAATFHPKVLIIVGSGDRFAIVGSANLSAGGFRDNVECSLFVTQKRLLNDLQTWFDSVFADENQTHALTSTDIKDYEPRFKRARKHMAAVRKTQQEVQSKIGREHHAKLLRWREAITAAKEYFRSAEFRKCYPKPKKVAVRRIKKLLRYPGFRFSRADWDGFYAEWDLGRLRQAWKESAWQQHERFQEGFRQLINDQIPAEERLSALLDRDGRYRTVGIGVNIVSKVLATHNPKSWPVYNSPVETTLKAFGYNLRRGLGHSGRYLAFREMIRKFMLESGAPDMLALDCFFFWYSKLRQV